MPHVRPARAARAQGLEHGPPARAQEGARGLQALRPPVDGDVRPHALRRQALRPGQGPQIREGARPPRLEGLQGVSCRVTAGGARAGLRVSNVCVGSTLAAAAAFQEIVERSVRVLAAPPR